MDLFQILKTKTGERETRALINYMEDKLDDRNREFQEMCVKNFATKAELKEEMAKVREDLVRVESSLGAKMISLEGRLETKATSLEGRLTTKIAEVEGRLETKITSVEGRLETKIVEVKSDVIRWMFGFFVAILIAILGIYLKK
jgi:hypothetical protein